MSEIVLNSNLESSDITRAINITKEHQSPPKNSGRIIVDGKYPSLLILDKLEKIVYKLIEYGSWPSFTQSSIEEEIKNIVGFDEKTIRKYLKIIYFYILTERQFKPNYYTRWDLSGILVAIKTEKQSQEILRNTKQIISKDRINSRQKCKKCRLNIRADGSCRCWKPC